MTNFVTQKQRGASLLEFAVVVVIVAVSLTMLLWKLVHYRAEAERVAVLHTVSNLQTALQMRLVSAKLPGRQDNLTLLAEENPFDSLNSKPVNYAGSYFSPSDDEIGAGQWAFDRTDHSIVYLLNSSETFLDATAKRLKFKVKLLRLPNNSGNAENTSATVTGVVLEQVKRDAT